MLKLLYKKKHKKNTHRHSPYPLLSASHNAYVHASKQAGHTHTHTHTHTHNSLLVPKGIIRNYVQIITNYSLHIILSGILSKGYRVSQLGGVLYRYKYFLFFIFLVSQMHSYSPIILFASCTS